MQQLYLTGSHAGEIAARLFAVLNVRPVGCRLLPFEVGGETRGEALRLLLPPSGTRFNDVPCRIRLGQDRWTAVHPVLEEIAAPSLLAAQGIHAPMLLDGLCADTLENAAFRDAVRACLMARRPVIVTVRPDAEALLRDLTPPQNQLWLPVPDDAPGQAALLETLLPEAVLRFEA